VRATSSAVLGNPYPTSAVEAANLLGLRAPELWGMLTTDEGLRAALTRRYEVEYLRCSRLLRPFQGAERTLAMLRSNGIAVAVTTTKTSSRVLADAAQCGLASLVSHFVTADDIDARPPDPRLLLQALDRLGVAPADALAVGDSPDDLIASFAVGVPNAAALYGSAFSREDLLREAPDFRLDDLISLVGITHGAAEAS
jgi:HAD superfamily hydrolase (TIGR01509 family)